MDFDFLGDVASTISDDPDAQPGVEADLPTRAVYATAPGETPNRRWWVGEVYTEATPEVVVDAKPHRLLEASPMPS